MKTAISLPDTVFESAETLATKMGLSRSELYTNALKAYLKKYDRAQTLTQLNQVYASEESKLEASLAKMQMMSLPHDECNVSRRSVVG